MCCLGQCRKRGSRWKGRGKKRGVGGTGWLMSAEDRSGRSRANKAQSGCGEERKEEGRERENGRSREEV